MVRVLGQVNGRIVAGGNYWHSASAANAPFHFSFYVHPDSQKGPVPGQMHHYLLSNIEREHPPAIISEPKEDEFFRTTLLEESQFKLEMRFPRSQIDVGGFDSAGLERHFKRLDQQGIKFITLTGALARDDNWQRHVWEMFPAIEQDVPTAEAEAVGITPFEEYAAYYQGELFRPDSWQIALDSTLQGGAQYVGMCVVNLMPTRPDTLYAGITGVIPSRRRRKIATLLKVRGIKYAQTHGFRYIYTDNEEHNPMYQLNLALGFAPLPAWAYYKKEFE